MGLARGWVAEEERRRRAGGGGLSPWGALGMGDPAAGSHHDSESVLALGQDIVGPLTAQALVVFRRTLGDGGLAAEQQGEQQALRGRDAGAARGGVGGSTGHGRQRLGLLGRPEQRKQQQVLLAEWYGMACGVVQYALRWSDGGTTGRDLGEWMALRLPQLTRTDRIPPLPQPRLAAALSGGYLPCLDTLLRRFGRGFGRGDMQMMSHLVLHRRAFRNPARICNGMDGTSSGSISSSGGSVGVDSSGSVLGYSHDLPWLLAYGNPRQSASLLASMAKVLRRAARKQQTGSGDVVRGWGGVGFDVLGRAAPRSHKDMVADNLTSMLCHNLGAAFDWMQEQAGRHPVHGSAAGAIARYASCASTARADGASAAGGDEPGAGDAAAGNANVAERLRLLLSFALAVVVPSLSSHLILQCRQLTMRADGPDGRCGGDVGVFADAMCWMADSLQPLLSVLLAAQKTVWRCRDLVSKARGAEAGPGSGGGGGGSRASSAPAAGAAPGRGSGGGSGGSSASAAGQNTAGPAAAGPAAAGQGTAGQGTAGPAAVGPAAAGQGTAEPAAAWQDTAGPAAAGTGATAGAADLGALADGLQGLLDGDADMAGLVRAALDCMQLLPAADGGQLAATALELTHCALWSCQYDMGTMRLPDGSPFLSFSTSSPIVEKVLWGASSSADKLRAAVTLARFAGYAAEARYGDVLVIIASRSPPGYWDRSVRCPGPGAVFRSSLAENSDRS